MLSAETWTQERNLRLSEPRETLIYLMGRLGREPIPQELLVYLAENLRVIRPQEVAES